MTLAISTPRFDADAQTPAPATARPLPETFALTVLGLSDADLAVAIQSMRQAVSASVMLAELEAEQVRRQREAQSKRDAITLLREVLDATEAELAAAFERDLAALAVAPPEQKTTASATALTAGRIFHSFTHDMAGITGERRYHTQPWASVVDRVLLAGGRAAEVYHRATRGRPPKLEYAWKEDVDRLRELVGPRPTRIGNGG